MSALASASGAIVAGWLAVTIEAAILGDIAGAHFDEEVQLDARRRVLLNTGFPRNTECRFDHAPSWTLQAVPRVSVQQAFELSGSAESAELSIPREYFVTRLQCPRCGRTVMTLRTYRRVLARPTYCEPCNLPLLPHGLGVRQYVSLSEVPPRLRNARLDRIGLRRGDVFVVRTGRRCSYFHYGAEVGAVPDGLCTVVVVGCGNVGSRFVSHVPHLPNLGRVVLVDPEDYEQSNLQCQAIRRWDVCKPKVAVQSKALHAVLPNLRVVAVKDRIENVPLALLAGAYVALCVDSRRARQAVNEAAWRVARCWVDTAIDPETGLVRLIAYHPGADCACIECAWSEDDYAAIEQPHPCEVAARPFGFQAGDAGLEAHGASDAEENATPDSGRISQSRASQVALPPNADDPYSPPKRENSCAQVENADTTETKRAPSERGGRTRRC